VHEHTMKLNAWEINNTELEKWIHQERK